jgi:very-short-patch-repair endonuclease
LQCRDQDPARREQLIAMNHKQQEGNPTRLELAGYALLDRMGIGYSRQFLIGGKFCVDAFVETAGLVIQFDGDYWHGNLRRFPEPDRRQQRRMALDRSQDAYMKKCGYEVFRIWESDFKENPAAITEQLRQILTRREHTLSVPE